MLQLQAKWFSQALASSIRSQFDRFVSATAGATGGPLQKWLHWRMVRPLVPGNGKRQDGDVVFLAKTLRGFGDVTRRHQGKTVEPLEAIEFSASCARFRDTIRKQDEMFRDGQLAVHQLICLFRKQTQRQRRRRVHFATGNIGRNMSCIRDDIFAGE